MTEDQEFNALLKKIKYDVDARNEFCFKYYNALKKHVSSKYGTSPDWEDIVHDVIFKIFDTDWTNYKYIHKPVSWLYAVADNYAKDTFKKTNRIYEFTDKTYSDFNIEIIDMRNDLRNAMKRLKRVEQYMVYAHYWLRMDLKTIAEEVNKSYVGVRVAVHRARKKLEKYVTLFL